MLPSVVKYRSVTRHDVNGSSDVICRLNEYSLHLNRHCPFSKTIDLSKFIGITSSVAILALIKLSIRLYSAVCSGIVSKVGSTSVFYTLSETK